MAALEEAEFPVWGEFLPLPNGVHNIEASSEEYLQVVPSRQHTHLVEILASGPVYLFEGTAVPTDDAASTWLAAGAHTRVVPAGVALYAKSLAVGAGGDTGGDDGGGDSDGEERGLLTIPSPSIGEVTLSSPLNSLGAQNFVHIGGAGAASVAEGNTFFFDGHPESEQTVTNIDVPGMFIAISPGPPFAGTPAGTRLYFGVDADVVPRSAISTLKSRYNVFGENDPLVGATSMPVTGLFTTEDSGLEKIVAGMMWRVAAGDSTVYTISEAEAETDPNSGGIGLGTREYVRMTFSPGLVAVPPLVVPLLFALPAPTLTLRAAAAATTGATTIQVDGLGVDQLAADQTFTAGTDTTEYTITTATALTGANEGKVSLVFSPMLAADIADNSQIVFTGEGITGIPEPTETGANTVGDPAASASVNVDGATADLVVGAAITFGDRLDDNLVYIITATRAATFPGGNGKVLTVDPPLQNRVSNDTVVYLYVYPPEDDSGDDGDGDGDGNGGTPMAVAAQVCAQVWNDVRFAHGRGGE